MMTTLVVVCGVLVGCTLITVLWLWHARRSPLSDMDKRLQAVYEDLAIAEETEALTAADPRDADVVVEPVVTVIPTQRTAPSRPRQNAQLSEPGSAA